MEFDTQCLPQPMHQYQNGDYACGFSEMLNDVAPKKTVPTSTPAPASTSTPASTYYTPIVSDSDLGIPGKPYEGGRQNLGRFSSVPYIPAPITTATPAATYYTPIDSDSDLGIPGKPYEGGRQNLARFSSVPYIPAEPKAAEPLPAASRGLLGRYCAQVCEADVMDSAFEYCGCGGF